MQKGVKRQRGAGPGAHTSTPGCQDSLQRLQKAKKHLAHCAQLSPSSRQAEEQRGQYTTSGMRCSDCASSRSSQRASSAGLSSPARAWAAQGTAPGPQTSRWVKDHVFMDSTLFTAGPWLFEQMLSSLEMHIRMQHRARAMIPARPLLLSHRGSPPLTYYHRALLQGQPLHLECSGSTKPLKRRAPGG